jgi:hypothetical protein
LLPNLEVRGLTKIGSSSEGDLGTEIERNREASSVTAILHYVREIIKAGIIIIE